MRRFGGWLVVVVLASGCAARVNVSQEQDALMARDREWAGTVKDPDRFVSFFADDGVVHPPGMAQVSGSAAIREMFVKMSSVPGFTLEFTPSRAVVGAGGDIGYTSGTYRSSMGGASESGKYVTVWKKQADGQWKVAEDIFNADASPTAAAQHVLVPAANITWGDAPPSLPPGAKAAVIAGDPTQPGPFTIRIQLPSGYRVPAHWHPSAEQVTVLSGTVGLGMGEAWDDAALQPMAAGSFTILPAEMRHYVLARTPVVLQVQSTGPFVINYVNPADDPSKAK